MAARRTTLVMLLVLLLSLFTAGVQAQCAGTDALKASTAEPCAMHCCSHEHASKHQHRSPGSLQTCEVSLPAAILIVAVDDGASSTVYVPASVFALELPAVPARIPSTVRVSTNIPPLLDLPLRI